MHKGGKEMRVFVCRQSGEGQAVRRGGQRFCEAGWSSLELSDGCRIFRCNSVRWGLLPRYGKLLQTPVCWLEHGDLGNFIQNVIGWLKNTYAVWLGAHSCSGGMRWGLQAEQAGGMVQSFSLQHLGLV